VQFVDDARALINGGNKSVKNNMDQIVSIIPALKLNLK
jgi:hypothetical protein